MILKEINKVKRILGKINVRKFYLLVPFDILNSLLEIMSISAIIPFILAISDKSAILNSEYSYIVTDYFKDYNEFILYSGISLILILFFSNSMSIYSQYRLVKLANEIGQETSQKLYKKYLFSNYKFHISTNTSELTKVLTTEVSRFTQNVLIASLKLLSKTIYLIIIVSFMMFVRPLISFVIIISIVSLYFIIYKIFKNRLFSNGLKISFANKNIFKTINESLIGIKETKFNSLEEYYHKQFKTNSDLIAYRTASSQIRSIIPKNIIEFILLSVLVLLIYYLNGKDLLISSLPIISFFLYSAYRALPALQQVYNSSALIKSNFESVNQINKYYDVSYEETTIQNLPYDTIESININNLCFGYSKKVIFLKNISININNNSFVGIIGKSGSGKSSFIDLLLKLLNPNSGTININNNNNYTYQAARSLFAYVPQDVHLSDFSISENIILGNINAEKDDILLKKSIEISGLSNLVSSLVEGMDSQIGENGSLLSGGQRKRLGLARAIYSQKPILILDEVTSGLDKETELSILNDLKLMSRTKIVILVTHNSHELNLFDQIINFDNL